MGRFERLPLDPTHLRFVDGEQCVDIGYARSKGACHFSTSDIIRQGPKPLHTDQVAAILGELMTELGRGWFGCKRFVLHSDGRYVLKEKELEAISRTLAPLGFIMAEDIVRKETCWTRKSRCCFFRKIQQQ
jgi:hypothetical protein